MAPRSGEARIEKVRAIFFWNPRGERLAMHIKALLGGLLLLPLIASAEPACVVPDAKNVVIARGPVDLTDGWGGQWWLQNVDTRERILMRSCGLRDEGQDCYFATDVTPGRYFFQEVVPNVMNSLQYPVSRKGLWFGITGKGVDYIGDWTIERDSERIVKKLEIRYSLAHLDAMIGSCRISNKKLFLSKTREAAREIVD